MFIIYPSCEGAFKSGRVKSKIDRKSSLGDISFLTSYDYIWFLFICVLYCAKEGIVVEISKVEKSLPLCKGSRKCKKSLKTGPYCALLFSRKENSKFLEVALSTALCNGAVGCIMNVWGYQHWIPHWTFTCFLKTAIKALKQGVKFVQT